MNRPSIREAPITAFRPFSRLRDLAMRADMNRFSGNRNGRVSEHELDAFDRNNFHGYTQHEVQTVRQTIVNWVGSLWK